MRIVCFLKIVFFYVFITLAMFTPAAQAMEDNDPQLSKSPPRTIKGVEVNSYDFFYLSFTPTFNFFQIDDKARRFLDIINPPRVRQELERLAQMSQSLLTQMPSLSLQIQDTLEKNQLAAIETVYSTSPSELIQSSFLLTPLSEDHLRTFRSGTYGAVFKHSQINGRVDSALKKMMAFGFFPAEREIIFSQSEIPVLHVLGLDRFFNIEDHIRDIYSYEGGDGSKHVSVSRCHEPCGWDGKRLQHISASQGKCWCLNADRHMCYSKVMSKIRSILYGEIQCKKLAEWDDNDTRFWTGKRELVGIFDTRPYYKSSERSKGENGPVYHPKSELSRFREIYEEAKKTYEEIKKTMTIDFIDQEINTLVERHAAGLGNSTLLIMGLPPRKKYEWQLYPAYEKLLHFSACANVVLRALSLASSAEEDFNREGPALRCGVLCVDVLGGRSCQYRAKVKDGALPEMLKELEYLIRIPYIYNDSTSKFLKRLYLNYEDSPVEIFYWRGYLTH